MMTWPTSMEDTTLRLSRTFAAPRERVFAAFTDPTMMSQWMASGPFSMTYEPLEPGVGPNTRFTMSAATGDEQYVYDIIYTEITPPERVVWTSIWVSGFPDQSEMVVTIEFADTGDGTEVSLTHEHFPAAEVRDHHAEGWTLSLDTLDALTGSA